MSRCDCCWKKTPPEFAALQHRPRGPPRPEIRRRRQKPCKLFPIERIPRLIRRGKMRRHPQQPQRRQRSYLVHQRRKFPRINPRPIQPGIDHHLHVGPLPPVLRDPRQILSCRATMRSKAPTHAGTPPPASPAGCPDTHSPPAAAPSPADRTPSTPPPRRYPPPPAHPPSAAPIPRWRNCTAYPPRCPRRAHTRPPSPPRRFSPPARSPFESAQYYEGLPPVISGTAAHQESFSHPCE